MLPRKEGAGRIDLAQARQRRRRFASLAGRESQRTVYILAAQYETDRDLVAATVAVTTAASIVTLFVWLTAMAHLLPGGFPR